MMNYVIITPVRDEAATLQLTIASVVAQTIRPVEWIIVNDGSTDATPSIIAQASAEHSWISGMNRQDRGQRKPGGGVVEAFNTGYDALRCQDWEFLVKLDGDLSFEPSYFEQCFLRFKANPHLGIGGGVIDNLVDGKFIPETGPAFHVRGATKIYRRRCWDQLGGLWPAAGWDTVDEFKAQRMGWQTQSFEHLHLAHYRPTGQADGFWRALVKYGRANYVAGYHPLFMICKCGIRIIRKPYLVGSVGILYGFLTGYWKRIPQVDDRATISYIRAEQLKTLRGEKTIWSRTAG